MRPNKNSVTADGFHDAWRSKPGTWARVAGVFVPGHEVGAGRGGEKRLRTTQQAAEPEQNRCRLQVGSKSGLDMM